MPYTKLYKTVKTVKTIKTTQTIKSTRTTKIIKIASTTAIVRTIKAVETAKFINTGGVFMQDTTASYPKQADKIGVHEAAKKLDMSPSSIRRMVDEGIIPSTRTPGSHRRIPISEIERLLNVSEEDEAARVTRAAHATSAARAARAARLAALKETVDLNTLESFIGEDETEPNRTQGLDLATLFQTYAAEEETVCYVEVQQERDAVETNCTK